MQISTISIPNPFFEGRNSVYVLHSDPVTLIDTGVATTKAYERLQAGLSDLGLSVTDIKRILITHKHIDHIGNAWRLQREGNAEIYVHRDECEAIENVDAGGEKFKELVNAKLAAWSVPAEQRAASSSDSNMMPTWEIEPAKAIPLVDGEKLEFEDGDLEVIHTPGHTIGSICLRWEDQLFSGDHVLFDLSPNIGAGDMRHQGVLKQYLDSLRRVQGLDCLRALPGHGEPSTGIAERCDELYDHHLQRLERIEEIIDGQLKTVYQIAVELFGELDRFHVVLGCAEANAHLELLLADGRVRQDGDRFIRS